MKRIIFALLLVFSGLFCSIESSAQTNASNTENLNQLASLLKSEGLDAQVINGKFYLIIDSASSPEEAAIYNDLSNEEIASLLKSNVKSQLTQSEDIKALMGVLDSYGTRLIVRVKIGKRNIDMPFTINDFK